jgi:hypothetical protein
MTRDADTRIKHLPQTAASPDKLTLASVKIEVKIWLTFLPAHFFSETNF